MLCHGLMASNCAPTGTGSIAGYDIKVAKVDTEYVYEGNIAESVAAFKASRRARTSIFAGFSPNLILAAREQAIDDAIRAEIRRFPGVSISTAEVRDLANRTAEEVAWEVYRLATEEGIEFETLAYEYSDDDSAREGGYIEPFGESQFPEQYQSLAYAMNPGEISEPFSAPDGWRIIRLESEGDGGFGDSLYSIRLIVIQPDSDAAEAVILDRYALDHTVEVLDPKYNSHSAFLSGNYDTALEEAERAVKRNGEDDLALYLKATALWELGRGEEALESLAEAASVGRVSDQFIPYYHYYRGKYLEELGRNDEALQAFIDSYNTWQQNINLAWDLQAAFESLQNDEYLNLINSEINDISAMDRIVMVWSTQRASMGVIKTGEGTVHGASALYVPRYRGSSE